MNARRALIAALAESGIGFYSTTVNSVTIEETHTGQPLRILFAGEGQVLTAVGVPLELFDVEAHRERVDKLITDRVIRDAQAMLDGINYHGVSQVLLDAVLRANPGLVLLAAQWSWSDTDVRDGLVRAIEAFLFDAERRFLDEDERLARTLDQQTDWLHRREDGLVP